MDLNQGYEALQRPRVIFRHRADNNLDRRRPRCKSIVNIWLMSSRPPSCCPRCVGARPERQRSHVRIVSGAPGKACADRAGIVAGRFQRNLAHFGSLAHRVPRCANERGVRPANLNLLPAAQVRLWAEGSHRKQRAALFRRAKLEQRVASIDHLVAQAKSVWRHDIEYFGCLEINRQLEFGWQPPAASGGIQTENVRQFTSDCRAGGNYSRHRSNMWHIVCVPLKRVKLLG